MPVEERFKKKSKIQTKKCWKKLAMIPGKISEFPENTIKNLECLKMTHKNSENC